jgi:hypothetical protein
MCLEAVGGCEHAVRSGVRGVRSDGLLQEIDRPGQRVPTRTGLQEVEAPEVELVGFHAGRQPLREPHLRTPHVLELDAERRDDGARDLLLNGEDVADLAVIDLRPDREPGSGFDQLDVDAHALTAPPYAALDDVSHLQDEPLANRCFGSLAELETTLGQRCRLLTTQPERIRSATLFHWWPRETHAITD